jgi:hypothetical protein
MPLFMHSFTITWENFCVMQLVVPPLSVPSAPLPASLPSGIFWEMREVALIVLGALFVDAATGSNAGRQINAWVGVDAPTALGAQWEIAAIVLVPLAYGLIRGLIALIRGIPSPAR